MISDTLTMIERLGGEMSEFETIEEYQQSIKMFKADCIKGFEVVVLSSDNDRAKLQLRLTPYTDKKCGYGCHDLDFGLSIYQHQQAKIDELQKRIDEALEAMDAESANSWGIWKEKACMYEQGASNAYERSYWILKGKPDDQTRN